VNAEEKIEQLQNNLRTVVEALIALSEANGSALDGFLALLPAMGQAGLIEKKADGTAPLMEALKSQHAHLHMLNKLIALLMKDLEIPGEAGRLSPSPDL
jgi:phage-related tail protein